MTKMIMITVIIKEKIKKKEEVSGFAARPLIERKKRKVRVYT